MGIDWIAREMADHHKKGQLLQMKDSFSRHSTCHQVDNTAGGFVMDPLDFLQHVPVLVVYEGGLRLGKYQCSQPGEISWSCIQLVES